MNKASFRKVLKRHLKIIQTVHDNYSHIQELEDLSVIYSLAVTPNYESAFTLTQKELDFLVVVCKTTQNSHYDYRLYTRTEFKNNFNHVDYLLEEEKKDLGFCMECNAPATPDCEYH